MANFVAPFVGLAALGSVLTIGMTQEPVTSVPLQTAEEILQPKATKTWVLSKKQSEEICLITKTAQISPATSKVEVDPTCAVLMDDSFEIEVWQQDEQGNVVLGNGRGYGLAEFTKNKDGDLVRADDEKDGLTLSPVS